MCARVGKNVLYLKRIAIGEVQLDATLDLGGVRELTETEFKILNGE